MSKEDDTIRLQIEQTWSTGGVRDHCTPEQLKPIEMRVHLEQDGTVTRVEPLGEPADACGRLTLEAARRAIMLASPLKLPAGKRWETLHLIFHPEEVAN